MKKTILCISMAAVLSACGGSGGGSGSSNSKSIQGVALAAMESTSLNTSATNTEETVNEGYVTSGYAYYDVNFNQIWDTNEPKTTINEDGTFDLSLGSASDCEGYAPVVVVVDELRNEDDEVIRESYQMTVPPSQVTTDQDLLAVSPLTTVVWNEVQHELSKTAEIKNCSDLKANEESRQQIKSDIEDQEWRVANSYNITIDQIYGDYVAENDALAAELATALVVPMQKGYTETIALREQNPTMQYGYVEYFWAKHSTNTEFSNMGDVWIKEEYLNFGDSFVSRVDIMADEDLETVNSFYSYASEKEVDNKEDNIEEKVMFYANYNKDTGFMNCSIQETYWQLELTEYLEETKWRKGMGRERHGYAPITDYTMCEYIASPINYKNLSEVYDSKGDLIETALYQYNGIPSGIYDFENPTSENIDYIVIMPSFDGSVSNEGAMFWRRTKNIFGGKEGIAQELYDRIRVYDTDERRYKETWEKVVLETSGVSKVYCAIPELTTDQINYPQNPNYLSERYWIEGGCQKD